MAQRNAANDVSALVVARSLIERERVSAYLVGDVRVRDLGVQTIGDRDMRLGIIERSLGRCADGLGSQSLQSRNLSHEVHVDAAVVVDDIIHHERPVSHRNSQAHLTELNRVYLLETHLLGHRGDHLEVVHGGGDRESDAGVARRRLDERVALVVLAAVEAVLQHALADAVLDRATSIQELALGPWSA